MGRARPSRAEGLTRYRYEEAARQALRDQTLEEIMEATPQATQRRITLASLDLVRAHRPDFQVFNELLVQYPGRDTETIQRVVPDNMVVLHAEDLGPMLSFNLPLQPALPFWVLEYVSASSRRKDYDDSFRKYERELKVPYYLIFYPDNEELTLYRLNKRRRRYDTVLPDGAGRCAVQEVDIEVGLLDGWTRFWFGGRMLPLPAELDRALHDAHAELDHERLRADGEKQRADGEKQRADGEKQRADGEKQRADGEKQRADGEKQRAEDAIIRAARLAARLRAMGFDPES